MQTSQHADWISLRFAVKGKEFYNGNPSNPDANPNITWCPWVLHAAARLVNGLCPHDHVTSALKELHWLPIKQRVDYKLCLLLHKVTVRQAPSYLTGMLTAVSEVPYCRLFAARQTETTSFPGTVWNSARGRFLLPPPVHGTGCQQNSSWCVPRRFSSVPWKRSCSRLLIGLHY